MRSSPVRDPQSASARPAAALLLLGSLALLGCGRGPQVRATGAWQEGGAGQKSFSRVLVVGVSPDVNQRCAFEQFMAAQMESDSVEAIVSCFAVKKREPLWRGHSVIAIDITNPTPTELTLGVLALDQDGYWSRLAPRQFRSRLPRARG